MVRQTINLTEVSPINPSLVTTNQAVSHLFEAGYVCAGETTDKPRIGMITEWVCSNALSRQAYIVASRMAKRIGTNKQGKQSVRCEDTVGPREYLVIESDIAKDKPSWKPHVEAWERDGIANRRCMLRDSLASSKLRSSFPPCTPAGNQSMAGLPAGACKKRSFGASWSTP